MRVTTASKPIPAPLAKKRSFIVPISIVFAYWSAASLSASSFDACSQLSGMLQALAKSLPVPVGITPRAAALAERITPLTA